jgi:multiple sugar transport system substrate-binding protein
VSVAALRIALVAGPMYDPLYRALPRFVAERGAPIEIAWSGNHPALNRHLETLAEAPYDLISTHTKYAPAQRRLLAPLDGIVATDELADFYPELLDLARVDGELLGLPRNFDVRLLYRRTDLAPEPLRSWDELLPRAKALSKAPERWGFVFPGRDSGLFGTFYELAAMGGAKIFTPDGVPDLRNEGGRWALTLLRELHAQGAAPPQSRDWHYDEVTRCYQDGHSAFVADWPGSHSSYLDPARNVVADRTAVQAYPSGPAGVAKYYCGSHTFALTPRGAQRSEARELLAYLTAPEQQWLDAEAGSMPVRRSVMMRAKAASPASGLERWKALEDAVATGLLVPPKLPSYPPVEDSVWRIVRETMLGTASIDAALEAMTRQVAGILRPRSASGQGQR